MRGQVHGLLAGAAFALYAATGVAAFAQPAPPPGVPEGPPPGARHMRGPQAPDPAEHAARLRDLLQLKPAQEPALQAFVAALQSAHAGMAAARSETPPATTPERLDATQQAMARHQAAMTAVIDATRRFYAQLDPAQKRAFDALPPPAVGQMLVGPHGPGLEPMGGMGPPPPPR